MTVAGSQIRRVFLVVLTALLAGPPPPALSAADRDAPSGALDVPRFLRADLGFTEEEVQRAHRGDVIVRALSVDDESVGIAGVALLAVPPAFFLDQVRRIDEFKKSPEVLQIGRFSTLPSVADLAPLTLDKGDIDAARQCRSGSCDLKLDARGIDRLRAVAPTAEVTPAFRAYLAEYAAGYLLHGNAGLMTYNDHGRPQTLVDQLDRIVQASSFLAREWPDLHNAVATFSGRLPDGLEDFTYWSKEKVGPRASITLTHVILRPPTDGTAVVASKQIYASHYASASLGLTVLADQSTAAGPRTLLIYVNRTRVDMFGGLLGGLKRPLVRSRARAGAERMMMTLRTKLESQFRQSR
jgi:hypothetical protein